MQRRAAALRGARRPPRRSMLGMLVGMLLGMLGMLVGMPVVVVVRDREGRSGARLPAGSSPAFYQGRTEREFPLFSFSFHSGDSVRQSGGGGLGGRQDSS